MVFCIAEIGINHNGDLKIAEKLADKSILPILRRGLKDPSLEIVERSAKLIRKFKSNYHY